MHEYVVFVVFTDGTEAVAMMAQNKTEAQTHAQDMQNKAVAAGVEVMVYAIPILPITDTLKQRFIDRAKLVKKLHESPPPVVQKTLFNGTFNRG